MGSGIEGAEDAILEKDLDGIAIWRVHHLLPRSKKRPFYPTRPLEGVTHLFGHHSGRLGAPGFRGLFNSTRYVVDHRNFPGCAYHLWGPHEPCLDGEGRLVCFRANLPETRSWHTGGKLNEFGESLVMQGNTTTNGLSASQEEIYEAVLPYRYDAIASRGVKPVLSWHGEASRWGGKDKPACPGAAAEQWLTNYRSSSDWDGHPMVDSEP